MESNEQRIESLESRLTHQEALIQDLNQQLFAQSRLIERLEGSVKRMASRLRDLHPGNADLPVNERPPHY